MTSATMLSRSLMTCLCLASFTLTALLGCASEPERSHQTEGLAGPEPLHDSNRDPDIVEVQLVASAGRARYLPEGAAKIWGYRDGSVGNSVAAVPGPPLIVAQGQTVVVHFTNELSEETTVHWHGLRVPNAADGSASVQVAVQPGDTFDYEFVAQDAGTFWYHPHMHADVQIERGLYGAVIVQRGSEPTVNADRTFMLDDVKLNADGSLSDDTDQLDVMLGRQGNVILANGVQGGRIEVASGARERWRFINAANGRYFNLRLPGHSLRVIGWDAGLIAEPYLTETLLVIPGERYEVLVDLQDRPGSELTLETVHYDRGHDVPDPGPRAVFTIAVGEKARAAAPLRDTWGSAPDLDAPEDAVVRSIELTEQEPEAHEFATFMLNGQTFPDVQPLAARAGDVEVWSVYNNSEMDHPFHVHGMFFRVLDVNAEAPAHDGWKDTVNIPQRQTLRFVVRYGDPGTWMYHCHILEHAERGMMGELQLGQ